MLVRQILPLVISHACDMTPVGGRTRFQKMVFLLQHRINLDHKYDFIAHDYGPYSPDLQYDIDGLIREEMVVEKRRTVKEGRIKYEYEITAVGTAKLKNILSDRTMIKKFGLSKMIRAAEEIKADINEKDLKSLLSDIYREYPDFARYSRYKF